MLQKQGAKICIFDKFFLQSISVWWWKFEKWIGINLIELGDEQTSPEGRE